MQLICGLGNPGKNYVGMRHNLGFKIVDRFAKKKKFVRFKISKKLHSLISTKILNEKKIILAKPQTFMNNSGKAVKSLITYYSLPITNVWIIHDDIDLPLGEIKIVKNRGAAGHKGVQSIIDELGTKNFIRFRIGIKPTTKYKRTEKRIEDFVLEKFNKDERKILKEVAKKTVEAIELTIEKGLEKTMSEFN